MQYVDYTLQHYIIKGKHIGIYLIQIIIFIIMQLCLIPNIFSLK